MKAISGSEVGYAYQLSLARLSVFSNLSLLLILSKLMNVTTIQGCPSSQEEGIAIVVLRPGEPTLPAKSAAE